MLHCFTSFINHFKEKLLYLAYLCPCLGLGLFMLNLSDLFFIPNLIFNFNYLIISFKQMYLPNLRFLKCLKQG